ncbi:uncharacterized protein [Argopecten irradians]|uniref:uncharacterized protein n=1 Tax=Argopecten irradians TaxID=31199 RepID=UPI003718E5AF
MSSSRRVQHDKRRLDSLKKDSVKLNQDVEHLQDALLLHQRYQEEEDTTVKGMIRKEIGGSIWQHGGAGKLRTYKSTKDLADPYGIGTPKSKSRESNTAKGTRTVIDRNNVKQNGVTGRSRPSNKNGLYKTEGSRHDDENNSYYSTKDNLDRFKVKEPIGRDLSPGYESPGEITGGKDESRTIGNYDLQKMEMLKSKVIQKASAHMITRKRPAVKSKDKNPDHKKAIVENVSSKRVKSALVRPRRENSRDRKDVDIKEGKVLKENNKQQTTHEIQALTNSIELESTENQKETRRLTSPKFPKQTNRILVGDSNSGSKSPLGTNNQAFVHNKDLQNSFHSPHLSPKQSPKCDPDVHLWLRRLGLLEEEKYVEIFAKNEIDMEELTLLSPEHLNNLGVVAVGAFNKIVRGIQELQQKSSLIHESSSLKTDKKWSHWESNTSDDHCPSVSEVDWNPKDPPDRTTPTLWQNISMQVSRGIANVDKISDLRNTNSQDYVSDKVSSHSSEPNHFDKIIVLEHETHNEKCKPFEESSSGKKDTKKLDINGNKRILSRSNSFSSRTSTSKPPVKREQERTSRKDTEKNSVKKKSGQSKLQPRPRSRSLTRGGSISKADGKTSTVAEKSKQKTVTQTDVVKVVSVDTSGQQKKQEAVNAAAKRLEERQKMEKEFEEKEQKLKERRKQQRDELAAKHLSREKNRRADEEETDTMAHIQQWASDVNNHTLADLLTVSVLDTGSHTDESEAMGHTVNSASVQKEDGSRPAYSRRAPKPSCRQSLALPPSTSDITKNNPDKFLVSSSLRISSRPPKHNTTKQGSSTAVRDLEDQIQSLQERAMSGEMITMDLVRDLQNRLVQVETQVTNQKFDSKPHSINQSAPDKHSTKLNLDDDLTKLNLTSNSTLFEETATDLHSNESDNDVEDNFSMMKEPMKIKNTYGNTRSSTTVSMSMSKQALLSEIKKEKAQHRKQIRHLNSELNRIRQTEPVRSIEVDHDDVNFDEQDLIGEGTFSRVYKGQYQGSEVAVKQLKIPLSSQDRNYFNAEVSLLRDLRHPRVVLLMGVCSTSRLPLMVLEYMARGSLYHHLHNTTREPLDHAEYFRISHDIALGMAYLHQQKPAVLHLDLKSMNVLICSNDRAKIADFGFSKLRYDANLKATNTSKAKPVQGSPAWMAPELLETGELTPKADVYSFGIILWEMLTRKQPYDGCSVFQVLERVRLNKRPELPSACPTKLAQFMQQCWAPVPSKRPPFKEILTQLEDMTFPSEWQDLFRAAGVPPEALEDVHSTRTLISLVTNSLDTADAKSLIEDIKLKRSFGTYSESDDRPNTSNQRSPSPSHSDVTSKSVEVRPTSSNRKSQDLLNEVLQSRDMSPRKINTVRSPREHFAQMNIESQRKPMEPLVIPTARDDSSRGTPRSLRSSRSSPDIKPTGSCQSSPDLASHRSLRNSKDAWSSPRDFKDEMEKVRNSIIAEGQRSSRNSAEPDRYQQNSARQSLTATTVNSTNVKRSYDVKTPVLSSSPRKETPRKDMNSSQSNSNNFNSRDLSNTSALSATSTKEQSDKRSQVIRGSQQRDSMEVSKKNGDVRKSLKSDIYIGGETVRKGTSSVDLHQNLLSEVRNSKNILKKSGQTLTPKSNGQSSIQVTPRSGKEVKDFQRQVINTRMSLRKSSQNSPPSPASLMEVDPRGAVIDHSKSPIPVLPQTSRTISRDSLNMSQDIEIQSVDSIDADSLDSPQLRDSLEDNSGDNSRTVSRPSPRPSTKPKPTGLKNVKNTTKSYKSEGVDEKPQNGTSTNWMTELSNKLQNLGQFSDQENSPDEMASGKIPSSKSKQQIYKTDRRANRSTGNQCHATTVKTKNVDDAYSQAKREISNQSQVKIQNGRGTVTSPPSQVPPPPPPAPPPPPVLSATGGKKQIVKPAIVSKDLPQASRATNRGLQCGVPPMENMDNSPLLVKSKDLRDQKEVLQSTSKPHPSQLHDLKHVKKSTMVSIAEILKKAVSNRRMALGEDPNSPPQSVASSWSLMDD